MVASTFMILTGIRFSRNHIEKREQIMARRSTKENKNIYQTTRENLDLTREEASELLETVSPERIEKIENERSLPYPDEVLLMSDKYKQPTLCNYYCANQCPMMIYFRFSRRLPKSRFLKASCMNFTPSGVSMIIK